MACPNFQFHHDDPNLVCYNPDFAGGPGADANHWNIDIKFVDVANNPPPAGTQPRPAKVFMWWADPFAGGGIASNHHPMTLSPARANGDTLLPGDHPFVWDIAADRPHSVGADSTHVCLFAQLYQDAAAPCGQVGDPSNFDPAQLYNAQHNVNVVLPAGLRAFKAEPFRFFSFGVAGLDAAQVRSKTTVRSIAANETALLRVLARDPIAGPVLKKGTVKTAVALLHPGQEMIDKNRSRFVHAGVLDEAIAGRVIARKNLKPVPTVQFSLDRGEVRQAVLELPRLPNVAANDVYAYEIINSDEHGKVLGKLALIVGH